MAQSFTPTLTWHLKALAVVLVFSAAALFMVSYAVSKIPQQYQKKIPAAETTPWLDERGRP